MNISTMIALGFLPSIFTSIFWFMMHEETDSSGITAIEYVLCFLAFSGVYIIELACIL